MSLWFTSDLHWQHANILDYCDRPFKSIREHDDALIRNWNACVKPNDEVYVLGDVSWASAGYTVGLLKQLKGRLKLIVGNHDHKLLKDQRFLDCFEWVKDYYELKVGKRSYVLFHCPISSWAGMWHGNAPIHLYGHTHQKQARTDKKRMVNVGVYVWNMCPVHIDQVNDVADERRTESPTDVPDLEHWLEWGRKYGVSKSFLMALEHKRNGWWYRLTHRS